MEDLCLYNKRLVRVNRSAWRGVRGAGGEHCSLLQAGGLMFGLQVQKVSLRQTTGR